MRHCSGAVFQTETNSSNPASSEIKPKQLLQSALRAFCDVASQLPITQPVLVLS
jgi:hypothetical protein